MRGPLNRASWCARFIARLPEPLRGESDSHDAALSYFEELGREETPEDCADEYAFEVTQP